MWRMKTMFSCCDENGHPNNGTSDVRGQVWGVYFGYVAFDSKERFKIVVSIRWDRNSSGGPFTRNTKACFINGSNKQIIDQPMSVTLVGYIRGFPTKDNPPSNDAEILDQDKSIAEACLNLAAYSPA